MKHDWNYNTISEVCTKITDGSHNPPKGIPMSEYLMISSQNVFDDKLDFTDVRYLSKESFELENKRTRVSAGDALLTIVGTIGRCCVVPENVERITLQRSVAVISPKAIIKPRFLMYCLRGQRKSLLREGHGIAQKGLYLKQLQKIVVPVPPLPVQEQICSLLDKMNRVIEAKKEQLKELDNLAQAIFYDMFGDPITNTKGWVLSTIDNISTDKLSYGSGASAVEYDGLTRYVRITDINDLGDLNEDIKSPSEIDEKYLLREGDILFARSGATVGKTYCHREKNGRCIYAGYLIKMRPDKSKVMPKYVFYYTKSEYYKAFIKNAQNAVAQPNINAKQYGGLVVPIPPLPLQQAFAEKVEAIEQQKELINQSIKDVQTLFDAKMDYYFGD